MKTKFMPEVLCPDCLKEVAYVTKEDESKLWLCRCGWEWKDDAFDTNLEELRKSLDQSQLLDQDYFQV
jgi:hypothetical protein